MPPEQSASRTANKGEWSEIYTFFKLVVDKSLNGADEEGNLLQEKIYSIQRIIRDEIAEGSSVRKVYDLTGQGDKVTVTNGEQNQQPLIVDISELRGGVRRIFEAIRNTEGPSFALPEAEAFMRVLKCTSIKATSADKSDIRLLMEDRFSPGQRETGFSIKSAYHAAPTLLNASKKNTSILYKIIREEGRSATEIQEDRVRDRVEAIYGMGRLELVEVEAEIFKSNLELIDAELPKIAAAMLANYFGKKGTTVAELTALLPDDPTLQNPPRTEEYYQVKVKRFLEAVALGMTPATRWDGSLRANGGFIVVRDDGELACYHIHDRDEFLQYLFTNTRFESPSTTRHDYGNIERGENGEEYIKLNFQIRFI